MARYVPDGSCTGELTVEVAFRGFAGTSSACFDQGDLLAFAERLLTYPLGDEPLRIWGGFAEPDVVHVGLTVRAIGRRGQLGVLARLAAAYETREVTVEVPTSYEALRRFAEDLARLVRGAADEARLDAEELA